MPHTIPDEKAAWAAGEFRRVLELGVPAYELRQLELFGEDGKFIQQRIDRKLYEPQLPFGGDKERSFVEKLKRLGRKREWAGSQRAFAAVSKWEAIHGWYYQCRPLNPRMNKDEWDYHNTMRASAEESKHWDYKWFHQLMLDGLPERVADFRVDPLFLLKKITGEHDRIVRFRNVSGESTGLLIMNANQFHAPQKFREFCLQCGNYNWGAGEKEVQKLHLDVGRMMAWRTVNEVASCGWLAVARGKLMERELMVDGGTGKTGEAGSGHQLSTPQPSTTLSGIWFFGDSAWADGKRIHADEHGVYWYGNAGYQLSEAGRENEFYQKRPRMMSPVGDARETRIEDLRLEISDSPAGDSTVLTGRFFREFCTRLQMRMGGDAGLMVIGGFLAYAAGPEIYEKYSFFPGVWLHGQAGSGKSTIMEWLMEIWGFHLASGLILREKQATAVGLMQAADQYSHLPVWLDEFRRNEIGEERLGVLHNAFNRGGAPKFNVTGTTRKFKTTFVVAGESTTDDPATRGRYPHQHVKAPATEAEDQIAWFNAHRRYFFLFGRFLIENRAGFVEMVLGLMDRFHNSPELSDLEQRNKRVYAVSYAALRALSVLLESHTAQEMEQFRVFMLQATRTSSIEVANDLNVNVFWSDLVTAFEADAIPLHCFHLESEYRESPPDAPNQRRWKNYRLYIAPEATLAALQMFMVKQHATVTLKQRDMQAQLSSNAYFLSGSHTKRFGKGSDSSVKKCWGIDLDLHPLGYRKCSDEEHGHYLLHEDEGDPRKGPLFAIVGKLEQGKSEG